MVWFGVWYTLVNGILCFMLSYVCTSYPLAFGSVIECLVLSQDSGRITLSVYPVFIQFYLHFQIQLLFVMI